MSATMCGQSPACSDAIFVRAHESDGEVFKHPSLNRSRLKAEPIPKPILFAA